MDNKPQTDIRPLTSEEIVLLKSQGCQSSEWEKIKISPDLDLSNIFNVRFVGEILIEKDVVLRDIPLGLNNCIIREGAKIENVAKIEFEPEAPLGLATVVSVLDETGSRPVFIYPGLTAQIATLMAREPRWIKINLEHSLRDFIEARQTPPEIGKNAVVINCGIIKNVSIGPEVTIEGASRLLNGSIINNAAQGKGISYVGSGVDAENFILEDGILDSKAIIRNCYIGQGTEISKGFTAHDSLFFANCSLENGEASAVLAGPYTVSMHKGTLLIGLQTSFMNAGSLSNQSNHMYKLGPVHWGVLERGVKTASGSYLMLGAKIGAFSLLMGSHKTHPDSSQFPFSYLFGDERGATVVVPGVMLRSCGLLRDEKKWPTRDRRLKRKLPFNDNIIFNVLNPCTVDAMLSAIDTIDQLLSKPTDDDLYIRYKGMKFTRASLERAKHLYTLGIFKYLSEKLPDNTFPENDGVEPGEWVDICGQITPREILNKVLETENIELAMELLQQSFENYNFMELQWIGRRFNNSWKEKTDQIKEKAEIFDNMIEEDRQEYLSMLDSETQMLSL